ISRAHGRRTKPAVPWRNLACLRVITLDARRDVFRDARRLIGGRINGGAPKALRNLIDGRLLLLWRERQEAIVQRDAAAIDGASRPDGSALQVMPDRVRWPAGAAGPGTVCGAPPGLSFTTMPARARSRPRLMMVRNSLSACLNSAS